MLGLRKRILGLDIGQRAVKGVMLSRRGQDVALEDYFYFDLHEHLGGAQSPDPVAVLRDLIEGSGFRYSKVASALEDRDIQMVNLSLPTLPEPELRKAVLNELEAQLGQNSAELAVDFSLSPSVGGLGVHAYYAKLKTVQDHMGMLELARLRPVAVESALLASLEAARFSGYVPQEGSCLLVDVGDAHTSVGLVEKGELVQFNTIRVGSGDINQSLMQQFGCDFQASELRKLSYRLEKEEGAEIDAETKAIEQGYYQIILGIHDTALYFRASRKNQPIQSVLIAGGGLMNGAAAGLIEQSLTLPVSIIDPLRKIQIFGKGGESRERLPRIAPMLHVAVGLALREVA
jgi:type IV pilus assembly protein PilM